MFFCAENLSFVKWGKGAEDLELTVETLRCKEDKEASGLVKKVEVLIQGAPKKLLVEF